MLELTFWEPLLEADIRITAQCYTHVAMRSPTAAGDMEAHSGGIKYTAHSGGIK